MSLVNNEYPIDDSFNFQNYLVNADIPAKYENYVKEIATHFYNENKKITLSKIVLFFYFRTNLEYLVELFNPKSELNIQECFIFLRFLF
ncbi:hypothetical protein SORDD14_00476 [Streptococcus oralis]|uniref:Uncharacterized protein n=1 Tax=Streptococcus oralis TaxID=1303 RepID=A0A139P5E3_STROR|nr:hypothetical protein SORDD14_00476 [Streptococcus oralis]